MPTTRSSAPCPTRSPPSWRAPAAARPAPARAPTRRAPSRRPRSRRDRPTRAPPATARRAGARRRRRRPVRRRRGARPCRAGSRKNAHDGCWSVSHIPTTKPIAASALTVTASSRRYCAGRRVEQHQQRRPEEVELLLDRERPVVQERRRVGGAELGAEVVAEAVGEHEVDGERASADGVGAERRQGERCQHAAREHHGDDHRQRGGGQDSPSPAGPEPLPRHRARRGQLGEQQARDQEAGHDEEHVDADEAASHAREA